MRLRQAVSTTHSDGDDTDNLPVRQPGFPKFFTVTGWLRTYWIKHPQGFSVVIISDSTLDGSVIDDISLRFYSIGIN